MRAAVPGVMGWLRSLWDDLVQWVSFRWRAAHIEPQALLKFPKGLRVMCPDCLTYIATVERDTYEDDVVRFTDWRFAFETGPRSDKCHRCGATYMHTLARGTVVVHTEAGWR